MAAWQLTRLRATLALRGLPCSYCNRRIHGPALPSDDDLYDRVPNYPEIPHHRNEDERQEHKLKETVKNLKSVEEKQYYTNAAKFFGWRAFIMDSSQIPPAALPSVQFVTNTTVVEGLPTIYEKLDSEAEAEVVTLAKAVQDTLSFFGTQIQVGKLVSNDKAEFHEHGAVSDLYKTNAHYKNTQMVKAVNRLIMANLSSKLPHLKSASVDHLPRNEAFWFRGPMDPPPQKVFMRRGIVNAKANRVAKNPKTMDWAESQLDFPFQFLGSHIHSQVRCGQALEPILPMDDPLVKEGFVPKHDYLPQHSGWSRRKNRFGTNLNGTWTGSSSSFSQLVLVDNINLMERESTAAAWDPQSELNERSEMLLSKLILNGFGMTLAQACNHGFSPFNDPLRPFVGQVAVTDGKRWKLGVYQLNKTAMQGISETNEEMLRNVCWHLPEQDLYSDIDLETGKIHNFNFDLLKDIVKMYMLKPVATAEEIPNEGYLDKDKRHVYQLKNQYNRETFTKTLREMYSNRPQTHRLEQYGEIQMHERLFNLRHPEFGFMAGLREMPWFIRAKYDKRGREFWHPEYRRHDNQGGKYLPKKFRGKDGKNSSVFVSAPIPDDE